MQCLTGIIYTIDHVALFADVFERCCPGCQSLAMSETISAEHESGRPVYQELEPEDGSHPQAKDKDLSTGHIQVLEQSTDISVETTGDNKPTTNVISMIPTYAVSPKPRRRLFGFLRRERDEHVEVQSVQEEEVKLSIQKEDSEDKPVTGTHKEKPSETVEVRTLQLTALQNTPFKDTVSSAGFQQKKVSVSQLPERQSSVKALCEKDASARKLLCTETEMRHEDISSIDMETSCCPQNNSGVENNKNVSPGVETAFKDNTGTSQEISSSLKTDYHFLVNLSKEDGTYRANRILIEDIEESLHSLTEAQLSQPLQKTINHLPSSVAFNIQNQKGDIPVPLPRMKEAAKINELKYEIEWSENEYTGPRRTAARPKDSLSSSLLCDQKVPLDNRVKSEGKPETSSYQTKTSALTSEQLQLTCHKNQVKAEADTQQSLLFANYCQTARQKDRDEEVRRSPSKTCHPRALPRESSNPMGSRLEGSPLKTFPININSQSEISEKHQVKLTQLPVQKKNHFHETKLVVLPAMPQDYQQYRGVQENTLNPPKPSVCKPQNPFTDNDMDHPISSWNVENKDEASIYNKRRACSLPPASSGSEL